MNINDAIAEAVRSAVSEVINPNFINSITAAIQKNSKQQESVTPYFNLNEAAKYLCVTRQSLTTYIKNDVVKAYRLNGSPRFKKIDLDAAMKLIEVKKLHR